MPNTFGPDAQLRIAALANQLKSELEQHGAWNFETVHVIKGADVATGGAGVTASIFQVNNSFGVIFDHEPDPSVCPRCKRPW